MKRRAFLKTAAFTAAGTAWTARAATALSPLVSVMPRRPLGRLGWKVSVVPFSGLALKQYDQETSTAGVLRTLEQGVNYLDVAPAYDQGRCETKLGQALRGVDRSTYFLACKTKQREAGGAREELERSLQRLKTDHFDVYQLHHLVSPKEVETALGPGGALETLLKAREEGKIRAIGFSAHTTRAALLAMQGFRFDTVMFPLNFVEYFNLGFGREVLDLAQTQDAAVLSIKTMSAGSWPKGAERIRKWWYRTLEEQDEINLAYRWTLSLPGVVMGFPPSWLDLQDRAIRAGWALRPAEKEDAPRLRQLARNAGSIFAREHERAGVAALDPAGRFYPERPSAPCMG